MDLRAYLEGINFEKVHISDSVVFLLKNELLQVYFLCIHITGHVTLAAFLPVILLTEGVLSLHSFHVGPHQLKKKCCPSFLALS